MNRIVWKDRVALVTGASSGLGAEFSRQIARQGGRLVIVARSEEKLLALARELRELSGNEAVVVVADLAKTSGVDQVMDALREHDLQVEHLVNNAGIGRACAVANDDSKTLVNLVQLNCTALTDLTVRLLPKMVERASGGVIQVASLVNYPSPYMAAYAASKGYVKSFTEALAIELQGSGVRMTAVCPGQVRTGFQRAAGFSEDEKVAPGVLSSAGTVRRGLLAYERGKTVVVTGMVNRFMALFLSVVPRGITARLSALVFKKMGRFE